VQDPTVDFHKFFDGENITQEDLVAWVNVGMHHIVRLIIFAPHRMPITHHFWPQPQAEDSPNTRTNLAASSFFLTPVNYFDADVSLESSNAVLLDHPPVPGEPFAFDDFGVAAAHCVPARVPPLVYTGLTAADLDGNEMDAPPPEELRKGAELFHRIKIEL
jgi:primary-amine oxidase